MRQEELMIGDWVQSKSDQSIIQIKTHWDIYNAKDFEPVSLTKEILKKNGFTKEAFVSSEHYYCNYNESHIRAFKFYGEDDVYVDTIEPHMPSAPLISCARFEYVHELQHALRLCKIDKEIKL